MGKWVPPLYGLKSVIDRVNEIAKIDEQINELAIKREECVKALKEEIKKIDNLKD